MTRGGIIGDSEAELIVVGGGLVGLTLAIACAEGGIRTIVVEAESADGLGSTAYGGALAPPPSGWKPSPPMRWSARLMTAAPPPSPTARSRCCRRSARGTASRPRHSP